MLTANIFDESVFLSGDAPLPDFGQRGQVTMTDEQASEIPDIWEEVPRNAHAYPPLPEDVEYVYMNSYAKYEWEPIKVFL